MTWLRGIRLTTWLTAGVLVLLPVLAAMQYRWLSHIGDDVGSRMRVVAENAARALSRDLGFELQRAWRALVGGRSSDDDADVDTSIVVGGFVVDGPDDAGALRVRRWDVGGQACSAIAWSDVVLGGDVDTDARMAGASAPKIGDVVSFLQRAGPGLGMLPLVYSGSEALPPSVAAQCPAHLPAVVLVRFDQAHLRERLLPELFRRHLEELQGDFRFAIVDRRDDTSVVYAPAGTDPATLLAAPDIVVPITFGREGPSRGGRDGRRGAPLETRGERARGEDGRRDRRNVGWLVVGRHRAGSLDAAVARLRNRNLVVSLGILLLMGGAVAMIAANASRAEHLGRQQVEFVASVSHEMRTPVAAIDVAARNLEDGVVTDPARVRQYGGVIRTEARRLADTVERVLQLSALDAGRGAGPLVPVDVRALVDEVAAEARREHRDAVVAVEHATGDATVAADPLMLRSCVRNLVGNALKYGGTPGWVRLRLERTAGPREEIRLSVEDHGPGIDARDRPHVFEPFYRGRLATEQRLPGSGLGLHIVKRCMDAMGGSVECRAAEPAGTTFTLALPALASPAGPMSGPADAGPGTVS